MKRFLMSVLVLLLCAASIVTSFAAPPVFSDELSQETPTIQPFNTGPILFMGISLEKSDVGETADLYAIVSTVPPATGARISVWLYRRYNCQGEYEYVSFYNRTDYLKPTLDLFEVVPVERGYQYRAQVNFVAVEYGEHGPLAVSIQQVTSYAFWYPHNA